MKSVINQLTLAAIMLAATLNTAFAGNGQKEEGTKPICLQVLGIAMDAANKPIDGVEVRLYKENEELEWTEITSVVHHEHSFVFRLETNEYYTIEISKPGFVTRSVGISTMIPDYVSLEEIFRYEFEVQMFKEKKGADDYYLDFPVALISYDAKKDIFNNNNTYTKHIKSMIKNTVDEASSQTIHQKK